MDEDQFNSKVDEFIAQITQAALKFPMSQLEIESRSKRVITFAFNSMVVPSMRLCIWLDKSTSTPKWGVLY